MKNITTENKGTIFLSNKVMVSDPCYGLNTWCQGVIDNVLPGEYECVVTYSDEGEWGVRVSEISVTHKNYYENYLDIYPEDFEVGVDSGQAGIFDYIYYTMFHSDAGERHPVDKNWYDRVCELTYIREKNPNYKKFECDWDDKEFSKKYNEYMDNWKISYPYLEKLDGNTIDNLGFVSSSGYGDGGYTCYTAKNEDGNVVSIVVGFIYDDEDEDE